MSLTSEPEAAAGHLVAYEERLSRDRRWALSEGSLHFEGKGAVQRALRRIASRLAELQIPYAAAGGMALFHHGVRRFTEDVDLLVTPEGLRRLHRELEGLGYVALFPGSKSLRDVESGVRIEFLVAGQYPGDGRPKPVAFPDPGDVVLEHDGIRYVDLRTLVELKLASGMTSPERMKDLADVQELIKLLGLPADFAGQLNPFVRAKYGELWTSIHQAPRRYALVLHDDSLRSVAGSLDELITASPQLAARLRPMQQDGVVLDAARSAPGSVYLVTEDPQAAGKYGMHDEAEMM